MTLSRTRHVALFLVAILLAALAFIAPAASRNSGVPIPDNSAALAAAGCVNQFFVYKGANGTGGGRAFCAEDYPLVRTPPTAVGMLSSWDWPDGTPVDNSATSYAWQNTAQPGTRIKLLDGYNFAGTEWIFTRPSVGSGPWNFTSTIDNKVSSYVGCGTSCSDEP